MSLQSKSWPDRLVSRFLDHTQLDKHPVGLHWKSGRPVAETALPTQQTQEKNIHNRR